MSVRLPWPGNDVKEGPRLKPLWAREEGGPPRHAGGLGLYGHDCADLDQLRQALEQIGLKPSVWSRCAKAVRS
jgi:hypothetical protein